MPSMYTHGLCRYPFRVSLASREHLVRLGTEVLLALWDLLA